MARSMPASRQVSSRGPTSGAPRARRYRGAAWDARVAGARTTCTRGYRLCHRNEGSTLNVTTQRPPEQPAWSQQAKLIGRIPMLPRLIVASCCRSRLCNSPPLKICGLDLLVAVIMVFVVEGCASCRNSTLVSSAWASSTRSRTRLNLIIPFMDASRTCTTCGRCRLMCPSRSASRRTTRSLASTASFTTRSWTRAWRPTVLRTTHGDRPARADVVAQRDRKMELDKTFESRETSTPDRRRAR